MVVQSAACGSLSGWGAPTSPARRHRSPAREFTDYEAINAVVHSEDPRVAQVPPEPESEFGDDLAVRLGPSSPGSASACIGNVGSGSGGLATLEEMPLPVPGILPPFGRAVSDKSIVHRVAEEDLEAAEVLVKGGASPGVPVVQVDSGRYAAPGRPEIRIEPVPCEAAGNHLVVDG